MPWRKFLTGLCFVVVCFWAAKLPAPVWAATEAQEEAAPGALEGRGEGFQPEKEEAKEEECPATFGPLVTDTAVPIEKGRFAFQPTFSYSFITDALNQNWRRVSAGGNYRSFAMDYKFTYGLMENLEVFVVLPYIHNWASSTNEAGPNGERSANFGGIGDINLTLKYQLVPESEKVPTVTALFATDFPTGHYRHLNPRFLGTDEIGGGSYVFTAGFNFSKYLRPFMLYANLWYSMATDYTNIDGRQHPRDFVTINLAGEYPFPFAPKWVALLEVVSTWDGGRLFGHKANVPPMALVSVIPGIEYMATDKLSFCLGVQVDVAGKNSEAAVTPLFSLVYAF